MCIVYIYINVFNKNTNAYICRTLLLFQPCDFGREATKPEVLHCKNSKAYKGSHQSCERAFSPSGSWISSASNSAWQEEIVVFSCPFHMNCGGGILSVDIFSCNIGQSFHCPNGHKIVWFQICMYMYTFMYILIYTDILCITQL